VHVIRAFPLALSLALAAPPLLAQSPAERKKTCAAAYVEAQQLRKDGALTSARDKLIDCGRDHCMAAIKKDCVQWFDEVNASLPSVVIVAKDARGAETLAVKVWVGDTLVLERLDAKAIELDPGTHRLRFELEGEEPIEQEIVLQEGRKNRMLEVSWQRSALPETPVAPEPSIESAPESAVAGPPVLAYVLAGVGVVALVGTGYFWLSSEGDRKDLEDSGCAPSCASEDVDSIERKRLFGDIALGVGAVSLGVAAYLLLDRPKPGPPAESARFGLSPIRGGALAGVSGSF
jgi:hypothetical protein